MNQGESYRHADQENVIIEPCVEAELLLEERNR